MLTLNIDDALTCNVRDRYDENDRRHSIVPHLARLSTPHWRTDICPERPFHFALGGQFSLPFGGCFILPGEASSVCPLEAVSFCLGRLVRFAFWRPFRLPGG